MSAFRIETPRGTRTIGGVWANIAGVVVLFGLIVLAIVFFWVALAVVGLALITAPIVSWWRRHRVRRRREEGVDESLRMPDPITGEEPHVVDAEFTDPEPGPPRSPPGG